MSLVVNLTALALVATWRMDSFKADYVKCKLCWCCYIMLYVVSCVNRVQFGEVLVTGTGVYCVVYTVSPLLTVEWNLFADSSFRYAGTLWNQIPHSSFLKDLNTLPSKDEHSIIFSSPEINR